MAPHLVVPRIGDETGRRLMKTPAALLAM
jgi:hypothetical protein